MLSPTSSWKPKSSRINLRKCTTEDSGPQDCSTLYCADRQTDTMHWPLCECVPMTTRACCVNGMPNHCPTCSNDVANTFRTLCSLDVLPLTDATHILSALLSLCMSTHKRLLVSFFFCVFDNPMLFKLACLSLSCFLHYPAGCSWWWEALPLFILCLHSFNVKEAYLYSIHLGYCPYSWW